MASATLRKASIKRRKVQPVGQQAVARNRETGRVVELIPRGGRGGGRLRLDVRVDGTPETEVQGDFVDEAIRVIIELEVEVEVRLADRSLVLENETAGDVFGNHGHADVAGDPRFLGGFDDCFHFLRLFHFGAGHAECRHAENPRRQDEELGNASFGH